MLTFAHAICCFFLSLLLGLNWARRILFPLSSLNLLQETCRSTELISISAFESKLKVLWQVFFHILTFYFNCVLFCVLAKIPLKTRFSISMGFFIVIKWRLNTRLKWFNFTWTHMYFAILYLNYAFRFQTNNVSLNKWFSPTNQRLLGL